MGAATPGQMAQDETGRWTAVLQLPAAPQPHFSLFSADSGSREIGPSADGPRLPGW